MPHHVVVDGSNIATEGRSLPSLAQLHEAVTAFMAEHPTALITVVVDATFGHRIDASEVKEFDEAIANNELVAPPAGAVGRGDAFVLSIAHKVGATILSNDSYQEFHGQYDWLFDGDRLIGGKPVPHIGWVFVNRVPVRGPISRQAVKDAKRKKGKDGKGSETVRVGSPDASQPMPVPKAPPPGPARALAGDKKADAADKGKGDKGKGKDGKPKEGKADKGKQQKPAVVAPVTPSVATPRAPSGTAPVNDLMPYLSFVEVHPIGTSVNAIVESYSSHGAYVRIGEVLGYVPLRSMAEPAPRSAREFMKLGESVTLVIESYAPGRRSIDLATAAMSTVPAATVPEPKPAKPARSRKASAATTPADEPVADVLPDAATEPVVEATPPTRPTGGSRKRAAEPAQPTPAKRAKRAAKPPASASIAAPEPAAVAASVEPAPAAPAKRSRAPRAAAAPVAPVKATAAKATAAKASRPRKAAAANPDVGAPTPAKARAAKRRTSPAEA
jgi:hypothetical protein